MYSILAKSLTFKKGPAKFVRAFFFYNANFTRRSTWKTPADAAEGVTGLSPFRVYT